MPKKLNLLWVMLFFALGMVWQQPTATIPTQIEQQRLAMLPTLKAKLADKKALARTDLIFTLNESFFNKVLAVLTTKKFALGELFQIALKQPRIDLKNGLALVHMQADLISTSSLINLTSTLELSAQLLIEQLPEGALVAKLQVIELHPADNNGETTPPPLSPAQITNLLPPLQLPLELEFNEKLAPASSKQTKPVALEVMVEPRQLAGNFQVTDVLFLKDRVVVMARVRNLTIK